MNCKEIEELAPLYLSGELEEDRKVLFHTHLAECRSCARQMEQQSAIDARLRKALCAGLPYAGELQWSVSRDIARERLRRWMLLAVAAAVLIGAVLGYRTLRPEKLYRDAALDHRLEVVEHQPRHWRTDRAEIDKLAARYQLHDVAALAPAGYRLEHAKMCGLDGQPALHLVFTNGVQEVSLFVRSRTGGGSGISSTGAGDLYLASFQNDRIQIIATGGASGDCLRFVRSAASVL
jgi:anti-sigma factor RsiW